MTDLDWLEEVHDKCTRVILRWPDADEILKHVRIPAQRALQADRVDEETLVAIHGNLSAVVVNYPDFEDDLLPTLNKIKQI